MNKKIALLTGGAGFIGLHLTQHLLKGGWEVHLIIKKSSIYNQPIHGSLIIHYFDGHLDELRDAISEASPSVIFHLASYFSAEHQPHEIPPMIESNLLFGTQLLEAANLCGVKNIVIAGTSWQHFKGDIYNPVCLYAATKEAYENIAQYYVAAKRFKLIILKLFDTYGPNDTRKKLFFTIKNAAETSQTLSMSPGEQLVDMVYIDDVVTAFELAGLRLIAGQCATSETFVVRTGNLISLRKLVELIISASGLELDIAWGGRPYRDREIMIPWNGGTTIPNWTPKINLATGIQKIFCGGTN